MAAQLRAEWAPVFEAKPQHPECFEHFKEFCKEAPKWDFSKQVVITVWWILSTIQRAHNSAPGVDGIPYAGWAGLGWEGAYTLYCMYRKAVNY
eukprot:5346677-Karenia_brevis.AAC.1